jgi:hypothetical protein
VIAEVDRRGSVDVPRGAALSLPIEIDSEALTQLLCVKRLECDRQRIEREPLVWIHLVSFK